MTKNRLQFCLATVVAMGAVEGSAQAQIATPVAPQQTAPSKEQVAAPEQQGQNPAGQPYPGQQAAPMQQGAQYPAGQPYPAQQYPAQQYPAQQYPAQQYPAQPYPGQPYPPQQYPAPTYPAQPYPGQPFPGQGYPGVPPTLNTTVHIDSSDREATLFQNTGSTAFVGYGYRGSVVGTMDFWQRVCRAPCDQPVDTNGTYSIRGNGIVPSGPFSLPAGQARVNVNAGHSGPRVGGWMLTALGGATFVGGLSLIGMGALFKSISDDPSTKSSLSNSAGSYMAAGGVMVAIGAGGLAGGIVLLVKSRTIVNVNGEATAQLHLPSGRPLYVNTHGLLF